MNMKPATILHTFFQLSNFKIINDKRRQNTLLDCVNALDNRRKLTLTALGRAMNTSKAKTKHNIKRVCRFLGNSHIHQERSRIYGFISDFLLKNVQYPLIVVDWSPVKETKTHMLRASLPVGGRSFTLYEEVYPESQLGSASAHKAFLKRLSAFIPDNCQPILFTDSGFKVPWIKLVEAQGWYWLSRVRGNTYLNIHGDWQNCQELFETATKQPVHFGDTLLTTAHSHPCQAVLVKKQLKGRKKTGVQGQETRSSQCKKYAKGEREPWLLATNLPAKEWNAQRIVDIYRKRMQIEESFRDTKNPRLGLSLSETQSQCSKRLEILLLIGMLAQFAYILIGKAAYIKGHFKQFQANTISTRRVLSYFYLGREIAANDSFHYTPHDLCLALSGLKAQSDGDFI